MIVLSEIIVAFKLERTSLLVLGLGTAYFWAPMHH